MPNAYRLHGKHFFLTYPQLPDTSHTALKDHLLTQFKPKHWIVCKEQHQDGGDHYHVYMEFTDKIDKPNGLTAATYKNVRPNSAGNIRNAKKVITYVAKDGDWISDDREWVNGYLSKGESLYDCLKRCRSSDEFLVEAIKHRSWTAGSGFSGLQSLAEWHYTESIEYIPKYVTFAINNDLKTYIEGEFLSRDRPKTLVLVGATRLGKTEWARSLGPHVYMKSYLNFKLWNQAMQYLVLDDVPWKHLKRYEKDLIGGQQEFVANEKYMRKKRILFGKPTIILTNDQPQIWEDMSQVYYTSYFTENTSIITITDKLY